MNRLARLGRLSIRIKLTAGFTAGLLIVLIVVAAFLYVRVDDQLLETVDVSLQSRADDLAAIATNTDRDEMSLDAQRLTEGDEGFSQILSGDGQVLASTLPLPGQQVLSATELDRALGERLVLERTVPGLEEQTATMRIMARAAEKPSGLVVVVVGATTEDHREALAQIRNALALGLPAALLISGLIGYFVAGRALAPVERIRRRAAEITLDSSGERLPLPESDDEIRRLGETLNAMLARIEASVERQRAFVSDASHELRTPLAVLKAELELAGDPGRSADELRSAIASAADEVDRLARLADDLLVLARTDQGQLSIQRENAELVAVCERVALRFSRRSAELGREVKVEGEPGQAAGIDVLRVEQAVGNLIDNALRHGHGTVIVSWSVGVGDGVEIEVRDQGPGFPEAFAPSAFERFSRADAGRTEGGTGLGLSIVKAIAEAHGGSVEIDGPAVRIRLPND